VTNWLGPAGFSCAPKTRVTANDTLSCAGTLNANTTVGGNIRMSPGPATGMGGQLFVTVGAAERGPFAITGP
jgi:hypothetical protein